MFYSPYDLHIHTRCSDGKLSSNEIYEKLIKENIEICSITDHDNMDFYNEEALGRNVFVIKGIELSTFASFSDEVHILGYGIDNKNEAIYKYCEEIKKHNSTLMYKVFKILRNYNIVNSVDCLKDRMSYKRLNLYLKDMGLYDNIKRLSELEAENPFLFDLDYKLDCYQAVSMIKEAGGYAFLAHPYRSIENFDSKIKKLNLLNVLDGIECYSPHNTEIETERLRQYCLERSLLISGGSDFHNLNKATHNLGQNYYKDIKRTLNYIT